MQNKRRMHVVAFKLGNVVLALHEWKGCFVMCRECNVHLKLYWLMLISDRTSGGLLMEL